MRIGWLADPAPYLGGAELTQAEFKTAAPGDAEIVDCSPGAIVECDRYVVHNCLTFTVDDLARLEGKPVTKYWHDVGPHIHPSVHAWFREHAMEVFCSPQQAEAMGRPDGLCIPPAIDYGRFHAAADASEGRGGAVAVGAWQNAGKAPHKITEWALSEGVRVDFYGGGPYAPAGSQMVAPAAIPALLARYERFVFLPDVLEPFGRSVAEAWAAGCEVVTNRLVGARWWIENDPEALGTAAADFWALVCERVTA